MMGIQEGWRGRIYCTTDFAETAMKGRNPIFGAEASLGKTMEMRSKRAIIIGAGPAGLTAAKELLERTDFQPVLLEAEAFVGGISRTSVYKGNRIDVGGHRFFSKSDRVMEWWRKNMPLQGAAAQDQLLPGMPTPVVEPGGPDPEKEDRVLLIRQRLSRIYYLRSFFDYPVSLGWNTVRNLGLVRMMRIGMGYLRVRLRPIAHERNLEQFFINRFGRSLYRTFFKDYTEKVWGVACDQIPAEWGAQRIKGISIAATLRHAVKKMLGTGGKSVGQKEVETSLIEQFLYPKLGPGQMWECVAGDVVRAGGELHFQEQVVRIEMSGGAIVSVVTRHAESGQERVWHGDLFFSTMAIKDLAEALGSQMPDSVAQVARNLPYRDFITVGLLLERLRISNRTARITPDNRIPDNWIYIQEPDVKVGRLQVFNNWSPYMVADPSKTWIGLEYFVNEGDDLWNMSDDELVALGIGELEKIGIIDRSAVVDGCAYRIRKAYPSYFGSYAQFDDVRHWLDTVPNLYCIGRNGMHRYNNQDHSMLTAMVAVDQIAAGRRDNDALWQVNAEKEYHESR